MSRYFDWTASLKRLVRFDAARAEDVNSALDELTAGLDTLDADVNRAIKLPGGTADQTLALTGGRRANLLLSFDANGNITAVAGGGRFRGDWATATAYVVADYFKDPVSKNIYATVTAHTAGVLADDITAGRVQLAINVADLEAARDAAAASADRAASSETAAKDSATNAANSATDALASKNAAATSAADSKASATDALASQNAAATSAADSEASSQAAKDKLREFVSVKDFGAVGDGAADDTAALKAAIDDVSAAGGGVVRIPRGTYKHTGLTLPANITLQGEGYHVTVLDYTTATGNGITLASGARHVSILDLKLHSSGASTGWAISGTAGVIGEFTINRYFITGFLKGIDIWQAINSNIGIGRMQGQGRTVAGGVGLRLGNSSTEISTTVTVGQTYFQDYETNTHNVYCPGLLCIGTVWESSKTAFKTAQHTYLYNCYWEANDTYDIDADGDGVVVFGGYGLDFAKVRLDAAYAFPGSMFHTRFGTKFSKNRYTLGGSGAAEGSILSGRNFADSGAGFNIAMSNPALSAGGDVLHIQSLSADDKRIFLWSGVDIPLKLDGLQTQANQLTIGSGAAITKHLSATATWDPASVADAAMTSTTVDVTGAAIGDTVAVGFSVAVPAGALLVGAVTAADVVTVTLFNKTGAALDLASGTLRADVWKH